MSIHVLAFQSFPVFFASFCNDKMCHQLGLILVLFGQADTSIYAR